MMRHFLIYLTILITLIAGCKKEPAILQNPSSITGNWKLRQLVAQIGTRNYASGNGSIYKFTDSGFSTFSNGNLIKKGFYRIIPDSSVVRETGLELAPGEFANRIIFGNDTVVNKIFYQVVNNKLTFISGYFPLDGGSLLTYEKQ